MRKIFIIIGISAILIVGAILGLRTYTKSFSPSENLQFNKGGFDIELTYSRPYKKDRKIFGSLVPYDQVWRTGANEATEITFGKAVIFGGEKVAPGSYTLFTIPQEKEWTIILNKVLNQWGAFSYDESKDVLRVKAPVETTKEVQEQFTIQIKGEKKDGNLIFFWDKTQVAVDLKAE